ncbi:DUF371 domain-containing protein [Candidatus Woesearchaeota archaeon]|nr:DUF371 domain-containing protein [Candidatus Woesearchaeota archaeon]
MIINGYGHHNITARHLTTMEFTTADDVSLHGDCIMACNARFDSKQLRELAVSAAASKKKLKVTISVEDLKDVIVCDPNPAFSDQAEIVIRMSGAATPRTLGINADKGAVMVNRELVRKLQNSDQKIEILVEQCDS